MGTEPLGVTTYSRHIMRMLRRTPEVSGKSSGASAKLVLTVPATSMGSMTGSGASQYRAPPPMLIWTGYRLSSAPGQEGSGAAFPWITLTDSAGGGMGHRPASSNVSQDRNSSPTCRMRRSSSSSHDEIHAVSRDRKSTRLNSS